MAHKKAHHEPTDAELKKEFEESLDAEIDKKEDGTASQRVISSTVSDDISEEDYRRLKLTT